MPFRAAVPEGALKHRRLHYSRVRVVNATAKGDCRTIPSTSHRVVCR